MTRLILISLFAVVVSATAAVAQSEPTLRQKVTRPARTTPVPDAGYQPSGLGNTTQQPPSR